MSADGDGDGVDGDGRGDLDALMGRLELEAAQRRAAPTFPIDDDARLTAALDGVAPGATADVTAALRAVVAAIPMPMPNDAAVAPRPRRWQRPAATPAATPATEEQLRALGLALVTLATSQIRRLDALEAGPTTPRADVGAPEDPAAWRAVGLELLEAAPEVARGDGRVWWSGAGAIEAVAMLRTAGADAYGTDPTAGRWETTVDGRWADPVDHVGAVGDDALAVAIVSGPLPHAGAGRLAALCAGLARTAATVVVLSPTPAWWRELVGPGPADLSAARPLAADTWIGALGGVGMTCRVDATTDGRAYRLVATRPPPPPAPA